MLSEQALKSLDVLRKQVVLVIRTSAYSCAINVDTVRYSIHVIYLDVVAVKLETDAEPLIA